MIGPPLVDPVVVCVAYAEAASSFDAASSFAGQARHQAAQRYGTPALQARYAAGTGGRDRQHELWQQRGAHVTGQATPLQDIRGDEQPVAHAPDVAEASVSVQVTARAAGGWTDQATPYRLDCQLQADSRAGWLVDDVFVEALAPVPATG